MSYISSKSVIVVTGIAIASLTFAACSSKQPSAATTTDTVTGTEQKSGDTTKSGKVVKNGQKFYLEQTNKQTIEIDSYTLDLHSYIGQNINATGQYSGDTLFVGSIE